VDVWCAHQIAPAALLSQSHQSSLDENGLKSPGAVRLGALIPTLHCLAELRCVRLCLAAIFQEGSMLPLI
jgi:hypothetical protein